jgi:hypothetical protein
VKQSAQGMGINVAMGRWCAAAVLTASVLFSGGCNIFGFGGAMLESYRRQSTKTVQAEYTGLKWKNWAVVVIADRSIQAELPDIVPWMTGKICERLTKEQPKIIAKGMAPASRVLRYQYDHPSWVTKAHSELAKDLQVDRLIIVEIIEYRLNDPGNQYLWNGLASGTVGVVEAESSLKDEFAFQKSVRSRMMKTSGPMTSPARWLRLRLASGSWIECLGCFIRTKSRITRSIEVAA